MILQQLYHDAGAILGEDLAPPMYDRKPVRWVVRLERDGRFLGIQSLGGSKEEKRGRLQLVPYLGRTSGVRPILIADSPAYVFGKALEDKEKRASEKHSEFRMLVKKCALEIGDPDVAAIDTFLSQWDPAVPLPEEAAAMTAADLVTFRVDGDYPTDNPDVQAFWAKTARPEPEKGTQLAECLVTGQIGPIELSLPGLLKRIPGGQSAGVAFISANCAAFESYGWERAQTSPISREAAERFTKALNHLIASERTHITIGGLVYVFWTKSGGDELVSMALDTPEDSQVRDALHAVWTGQQSRTLQTDAFYGLALSASGGRAVVRDWLTTTVGQAYGNLERWFAAQKMVMPDGADGLPLGVRRLAASLYRDPRKDMEPSVPAALVRAALYAEAVPKSFLDKAVLRCRAERRVTRNQAMLIKACLVTDPSLTQTEKEQYQLMSQLYLPQNDPAYLCGRLLAELDYVQYAALGKLNVTLVDRYFGAASTAPATVFGALLTNANKAHLPKLRKTKPGVYQALQKRIEEIVAPTPEQPLGLMPFPKTLTLHQQGLFALGFYHQRAADRKAASDAKAQKNAALADLPEDLDAVGDTENDDEE
jgi:CRISPR-associated protein Csd1